MLAARDLGFRMVLAGKAEAGSAEEQPARISLMDGDDKEGASYAPSAHKIKSSLSLIPKQTYLNMLHNKKINKNVWIYHRNKPLYFYDK